MTHLIIIIIIITIIIIILIIIVIIVIIIIIRSHVGSSHFGSRRFGSCAVPRRGVPPLPQVQLLPGQTVTVQHTTVYTVQQAPVPGHRPGSAFHGMRPASALVPPEQWRPPRRRAHGPPQLGMGADAGTGGSAAQQGAQQLGGTGGSAWQQQGAAQTQPPAQIQPQDAPQPDPAATPGQQPRPRQRASQPWQPPGDEDAPAPGAARRTAPAFWFGTLALVAPGPWTLALAVMALLCTPSWLGTYNLG